MTPHRRRVVLAAALVAGGLLLLAALVLGVRPPGEETRRPDISPPPPDVAATAPVEAARQEEESGRTVAVTVVVRASADDAPIVGAEVEALRASESRGTSFANPPEVVRRATTDGAGRALVPDLPEGAWVFVAAAPDHARVITGHHMLFAVDGPRAITIHLGRGYALEGTVSNRRGLPLEGIVVAVRGRRVLTNAAGTYCLDSLAFGAVSVFAGREGRPLRGVGRVQIPDLSRFDFVLAFGGPLTGRVLDARTLAPIEGAEVHADDRTWGLKARAVSGKDGTYRFDDLPECEIAHLSAFRPGWRKAPADLASEHAGLRRFPREAWNDLRTMAIPIREGVPVAHDLLLVPDESKRAPEPVDSGEHLEGVVETPDGNPVAGAHIVAEARANQIGGRTDARGNFRVAVPGALTARVRAWKPGYRAAGWTNAVPGTSVRLTIEPAPSIRLTGRVRAVLGPLPSDTYVQVIRTGGAVSFRSNPVGTWASFQEARRWPVRPDGSFLIELPDAGDYIARAAAPGRTSANDGPFHVDRDDPVPYVDLELRNGHTLSGAVQDEASGAPVPGAGITLSGGPEMVPLEHYYTRVATTDGAGRFRIEHLPFGTYGVHATTPEGRIASASVDVPGRSVELRIAPRLAIEGAVRRDDGSPAAGLWIGARNALASTDANGRFRLEGVSPGRVDLRIHADPTSPREPTRHLIGGRNVDAGTLDLILIATAGETIAGVVLAQDGTPCPGSSVQAWMGGESVKTNADGSFVLRGLEPGRLGIRAQAQGFRPSAMTVETGRVDLRIELAPAPTIRGRFVDSEGRPIAFAMAKFRDRTGRVRRLVRTTSDGRFARTVDRPGPFTIEVKTAPGTWTKVGEVVPDAPPTDHVVR